MNKMFCVVNAVPDVLFAARHLQDSPVGIIAGSAVAVVLCMLIVIIMVIIFLRRSVHVLSAGSVILWTPCRCALTCTRSEASLPKRGPP